MKSFLKKIVVILLEVECRIILAKYKPTIIAVTGSVGKTSTKDAIYTALTGTSSIPHSIRRNQKSFNSELGVPLTILGQDNAWGSLSGWLSILLSGLELIFLKEDYPKTLIVEVGADHPGDIKNIVRWIRPDVAVLTKISKVPVHIEFFPTPEALANEKSQLLVGVKKGGVAVLSADDEIVMAQKEKAVKAGASIVTFGIQKPLQQDILHGEKPVISKADVVASDIETVYRVEHGRNIPAGMKLMVSYKGVSAPLHLVHVLGLQHVYPVLGGIAIALARGISLEAVVKAFDNHEPPRGRMNILEGINGVTLIDDSYNASPDAMDQALAELAGLRTQGRKIAALGDMMELGKHSVPQHLRAGGIAKASADVLVVVGMRSKGIAQGALDAGMDPSRVHSFERSSEAADFLKSFVTPGDVVLVKGSQSIRMERVARALLKEGDRAKELLVRHDEEWLAKP